MQYTLDVRHKRCSRCKVFKPCLDSVWSRNNKGRFRSECKACRAYEARSSLRANKPYPTKPRSLLTPEQLAKRREAARKGQVAYRLKYPDRVAAFKRRWAQENPGYRKAQKARRRSRLRQARGTITTRDVQTKYAMQHGECYYCQAPLEAGYHVDHVIPISRGGDNSPANTVLACPPCNMSKHDKTPEEWELWKANNSF